MNQESEQQAMPAKTGPADPSVGTAKEDLFAGLEHHFHTSINGLTGMLARLDETALNPMQQEIIRQARSHAETAVAHFANMFTLSGMAAGIFAPRSLPFDFLEILTRIEAKYFHGAARERFNLSVQAEAAECRFLVGDAEALRRILDILIDSATRSIGNPPNMNVRAAVSPNGLLRLDMSFSHEDDKSGSHPIFPLLNRDGITDFYDSNLDATSRLQLLLCQKLIEQMSATIINEHDPANGSFLRLVFEVPMLTNCLAGNRVMLVGEHSPLLFATSACLNRHAAQADTIASAGAALQALALASAAGAPYKMAALDFTLADFDCEALGAIISADSVHQDTVLLMMNAPSAVGDLSRLKQSGFSALVRRQTEPQTLVETLAHLSFYQQEKRRPPFLVDASPHNESLDGTRISFEAYRTLVVDDNAVNCQVALHMMHKLGIKADFATNGKQAVSMHARHAYDFILMDCDMPVTDGFWATEQIRAMEKGRSRTPIIAWTANTLQDERARCLQSGMDDLLPKPTRLEHLQEKIALWLSLSCDAPVAMPDAQDQDEFEIMQELFGDHFSELADLFRSDAATRIAALREAVVQGYCTEAAKLAHALRGSSASIGAIRLSALCQEVQVRCNAGLHQELISKMKAIDSEFHRIQSKFDLML